MSLIDGLYALIASPVRAIGFIIPDVTIEEIHRDSLVITDHPVETGAAITDHAFMMPAQIEMRCGWSNSTAATEGYVQAVYAALISLQKSRVPFGVFTGKRSYSNMLIQTLEVITDQHTENVLMVSCQMREIIIVSTQTTAVPAADRHSTPASTAPVEETGV